MAIDVKICGIRDEAALARAIAEKARFVGFVFHEPSPRNIAIEAAIKLNAIAKSRVETVGLFVDPTDDELDAVLSQVDMDVLQLHGAESAARVAHINSRYGRRIIKALGVRTALDIDAAVQFKDIAHMILFDAKPEDRADLPGGNGVAFEWELCRNFPVTYQWMLSGGLDPANVAAAIRISGARAVDVSSGVESQRGIKDPDLISAFIRAAHSAIKVEQGEDR